MLTLFHVTPISNLESILEKGLIPQIGERSEGIEQQDLVFLFKTYEDCETALGQWLGAEFDDLDEELVSLKVDLPLDFPLLDTGDWEMASVSVIEPTYISFWKNEG